MILIRLLGVGDIATVVTSVGEAVWEVFGLHMVLHVGPGLVAKLGAYAAHVQAHRVLVHEVIQVLGVG